MIIPTEKMKDLSLVTEIMHDTINMINSTSYEQIKMDVVANDWSTNPNKPSYGNWNFSLYNKHWTIPEIPEYMKSIQQKIEQIPDCFQSFINFIRPNTILPKHMDDETLEGNMGTLRCAGIKCYQVSCGIVIPSIDSLQCGLDIDGTIVSHGKGEIIVFDGTKPHWGWNKTDSWRVTLILDMYKTGFTN
jgi:hypothetical protein